MFKITNVVLKSLRDSIYVKPITMHYTLNGHRKTWDFLSVHDSVVILLHNISKNVVVLVKQFRPAVYFCSIPEEDRKGEIDTRKYPSELGITIEMCAGIVDKRKSLEEIAKEEVLEECGYEVPTKCLQKIGACRSGVTTQGAMQTLYYCEITDDMKVSPGGGVGSEIIEVVEMPVNDFKSYVKQDNINSPPGFMFGAMWFLYTKVK